MTQDFGTFRWRLSNKITPVPLCAEGARDVSFWPKRISGVTAGAASYSCSALQAVLMLEMNYVNPYMRITNYAGDAADAN
jgi:hypothetical protein